jgi:serine/threonine protein phosphatase PrpC
LITSTNLNNYPVKEDKSGQKNEWLIVVADGHGALGHNVSQMIVETMPKTFEENKKKLQKQLEL